MTEIDVWLKKILAVEKHHPDVAIKYFNKIEQKCKTKKEKLAQKRVITNEFYQKKGIVLEKLGRQKEAEKCFAIVKRAQDKVKMTYARKKIREAGKIKAWHDKIWSRILKNEGKLMKTKSGVVFSYEMSVTGKSIIPHYRLQYRREKSGPKFPIYGVADSIGKALLQDALRVCPTVGPTQLGYLMEGRKGGRARLIRLWAILHDKRIRGKDY